MKLQIQNTLFYLVLFCYKFVFFPWEMALPGNSREGKYKTSYKSAPIAIFRGKDFGRGCSLGDVGAAVTLVAPHQIV